MTRVVEDLISLISTLSLPFSITVLPPPSLPPLSACSVTLSPSPTSPPYAVVSNFTDFHGRQHGVRGGVKKMIQIRKNFAQTIEAEVDVGRIWEGKGEVGWKVRAGGQEGRRTGGQEGRRSEGRQERSDDRIIQST